MEKITSLSLHQLPSAAPELANELSSFYTKSCISALEAAGHKPGTELMVDGDFKAKIRLDWKSKKGLTEIDQRTAAENGAVALSLLLLPNFTVSHTSMVVEQ